MELESPSGQPSIELFGYTIMEPMVTFTDLWITAVCIYAFVHLRTISRSDNVHRLMLWYFVLMAIATFLGGVLGHAFQAQIAFHWKLPGWLISMLAVSAIERATILYAKPLMNQRIGGFLEIANLIELIVFAVLTFITLNFFYIKVHSAYGLGLVVLPIHFYIFMKTKNRGSKIICNSVLFASLAAFFYTSEIGIHTWFNHLDVAHTVMAISLFYFYKGAKHLNPIKETDILEEPLSFGNAIKQLFSRG